jgi:hypothetical protein
MISDKAGMRGVVTLRVFGSDGQQKRRTSWNIGVFWAVFLALLKARFGEAFEMLRYESAFNHNIVTRQGDALVADALSDTQARVRVNNANGRIGVGTGYTGTGIKNQSALNTPTGARQAMDTAYPHVQAAFGSSGDGVVLYHSTFGAGALNATGINEAGIFNAATAGDIFTYAQVTPAVNMGLSDTLVVQWAITFLGS